MKRIFLSFLMMGLLGCSPYNDVDKNEVDEFEINVPRSDLGKPSEQLLAEAAATVSRSISQLAQLQRAKNPGLYKPVAQQPLTKQTSKLATVKWTGPVEPLLKQMANRTGLKFNTLGQKPSSPIIVTLDVKQLPVAEIVKNVAYQAQNHASIHVDASKEVIELRYLHS